MEADNFTPRLTPDYSKVEHAVQRVLTTRFDQDEADLEENWGLHEDCEAQVQAAGLDQSVVPKLYNLRRQNKEVIVAVGQIAHLPHADLDVMRRMMDSVIALQTERLDQLMSPPQPPTE